PLLHEPRLLLAGAPPAGRVAQRHGVGLQVLPAGDPPARARPHRGRGLVLGHGVHGAGRAGRPAHRRGARRLPAPLRQAVDREGHARLGAVLRPADALPAPPARRAVKALEEMGWRKAARFGWTTLAMLPYRAALFPQLRAPWLRLLGARIGRRPVVHGVRFFNLYRRGLPGLEIGDECFLGDECLFDLAEGIRLESQVTLAERVLILTHMNVCYQDHPLQAHFPAMAAPVVVERGCFLGASVTVL